eukprot:COSAG01_NODE_2037_length_8579_cov_119.860849_10_plen_185_part_00
MCLLFLSRDIEERNGPGQIAAPLGLSGMTSFDLPHPSLGGRCPPMTINKEDGATLLEGLLPCSCCVPLLCCLLGCCGAAIPECGGSQMKMLGPVSKEGARMDGGVGLRAIRGDMGLKSTASDLTKFLQMLCSGGQSADGAASVASFLAAVLAKIFLCNVCSCQEILRRNGRGQVSRCFRRRPSS